MRFVPTVEPRRLASARLFWSGARGTRHPATTERGRSASHALSVQPSGVSPPLLRSGRPRPRPRVERAPRGPRRAAARARRARARGGWLEAALMALSPLSRLGRPAACAPRILGPGPGGLPASWPGRERRCNVAVPTGPCHRQPRHECPLRVPGLFSTLAIGCAPAHPSKALCIGLSRPLSFSLAPPRRGAPRERRAGMAWVGSLFVGPAALIARVRPPQPRPVLSLYAGLGTDLLASSAVLPSELPLARRLGNSGHSAPPSPRYTRAHPPMTHLFEPTFLFAQPS